MAENRRARIAMFFKKHAEDVALAGGVIAVGVGAGLSFGAGYGLMSAGALSVAYGVWITERGT